jgi:hypothetical protein
MRRRARGQRVITRRPPARPEAVGAGDVHRRSGARPAEEVGQAAAGQGGLAVVTRPRDRA